MRRLFMSQALLFSLLAFPIASWAVDPPTPGSDTKNEDAIGTIDPAAVNFFDLLAHGGDGALVHLSDYKGKVLLVVNTASRCGHTPQYEGLQRLQKKYGERGFSVLAFPSNDFGGQEPGSDKEIKAFCKTTFNIDFPLFKKESVTGKTKQPVFKFLTESGPASLHGDVKWNFEKFLIDRSGRRVARFASDVSPDDGKLLEKLEALLKEPVPKDDKAAAKKKRS